MGYRLGVDLGTTFTAAAVADGRASRPCSGWATGRCSPVGGVPQGGRGVPGR